MDYNKVILIGRATDTPELRSTDSNVPVTSFGLATHKYHKDNNDEVKQTTEFHSIVAWRKAAETLAQHLVKGQMIRCEGELQTRSYEKDGVTHKKTEIVLDDFQFGRKPADNKNADSPTPEYTVSNPRSDGKPQSKFH